MKGSILALDYGTKKFGLAYSDEDQSIAATLPLLFVRNEVDALAKISEVIQKYNIQKILIGLPLGLDDKPTKLSEQIENFVTKLESLELEIEAVNEVMTSALASQSSDNFKKNRSDSEAARIMLQEYLDHQNSINS